VLYKMQKYTRRTDYPVRPWYKDWAKALADAGAGSIDANTLKAAFQHNIILLESDDDFTVADRNQYVKDFTADRDTALMAMGGHHLQALKEALASASMPVTVLKSGENGRSAVNTNTPTALSLNAGADNVFVPGQIAAALRNRVNRK
jgi:hypothetical protein